MRLIMYFAESGYDIMAFYQANQQRLRLDSAIGVCFALAAHFPTTGEGHHDHYYSEARAVDCFDNDLAGHLRHSHGGTSGGLPR